MTKGMGKGASGIRKASLTLASALLCAAAVLLITTAPNAFGAKGHDHPHVQGTDPSLGQKVGDASRFTKEVSVTGEIWVVEAHDPKNSHPYLKLLRTRDDRMYGLYGSEASKLNSGKRYEVTGQLDPSPANFQAAASADILVSEARRLPSPRRTNRTPQLSEMGKAGFLLAFVSWPGSGPTSFARDAEGAKRLRSWSSVASNGKFLWDPVETVEIKLSEPLAGCDSQGAPIASWVDTVRKALEEDGVNLKRDFKALGLAFPERVNICSNSDAYAFVSSPPCEWYEVKWCNVSVYGSTGTQFWILVHELGHTLGLPHANTMLCQRDGSPVVLDFEQGCPNVEYGDRFDNMGTSYEPSSFNPAFNDRLGWIADDEAVRIPHWKQTNQEVTLYPYGDSLGVRMLQTGLPMVGSPSVNRSPGRLYVEYRTRVGLDNFLYPDGSDNSPNSEWACPRGVDEAVYLRIVPNPFGRELFRLDDPSTPFPPSFLLDTTPLTPTKPVHWDRSPGLCDAGLQPGESWEDPTGKLKIDFLRRAADFSTATIRVRSEGAEGDGPTLELEKVGEGKGKIVIEEAGIECEGKCTHELEDESRLTARAIPARGSVFKYWAPDPSSPPGCGQLSSNPTCSFIPEWGQRKVLRAYFEPDLNLPRPDIELSAIQLTPATLKLKSGKSAKLTVEVTNSGLDEGEAKVALSSSSPAKAKVPGSVSFKVPGESSATRSFTVSTVKKQKGKVTITAKLGSQTAQASLVLAK